MKSKGSCLVYETPCVEHGFFHGAEASELREGVESLIQDHRFDEDQDDYRVGEAVNELCDHLQALLDKVDARDSLARMEAQAPPRAPRKRRRPRSSLTPVEKEKRDLRGKKR